MILDIFLEEAEEISEAIESILQKWESSPDDLLPVAELQRELHTMKGGARMAELPEVASDLALVCPFLANPFLDILVYNSHVRRRLIDQKKCGHRIDAAGGCKIQSCG